MSIGQAAKSHRGAFKMALLALSEAVSMPWD
jgi:hypothetical protein